MLRTNLTMLLTLIICGWLTTSASAQETAKSDIEDVTVYLQGAEIAREASLTLQKGVHELVFEGLSNYIDQNSLQVSGNGNFTILSAKYQVNYLKGQKKSEEEKGIEDSIKLLEKQIGQFNNKKTVYNDEYQMIIANKDLSGEKSNVTVSELQSVADFYRTRLYDIKDKISELDRKLAKLNKRLSKLRSQLNTLNAKNNKPTGEVVVKVSADQATQAGFEIKYFVRQAGWIPTYDLRASSTDEPVQLHYKAKVWQNTNVDWPDVDLSLSTGRPTQGGTAPELSTWWIDFYTPTYTRNSQQYQYKKQQYQGKAKMASPKQQAVQKSESIQDLKDAETSAAYTQVQESQLSTTFSIDIPYSIPSDGKQHLVEVQTNTLPAHFKHYAAPKLDSDAFLRANITDWEQYNLLNGTANIFYEGAYVGKTSLDTRQLTDTLKVSFGRDKNIVIKREKKQDYTKKQFIGGKKKETYAYEITIRNKKDQAVDLTLVDQIPVSKHDDIKVALDESDQANHNKETGELTWNLTLDSQSNTTIRFVFTVEYPKDKQLSNL